MKKSILNLGKHLDTRSRKAINGGRLKPTKCCDPALQCCTTSYTAINNPSCGGNHISGCQYHPATNCCI